MYYFLEQLFRNELIRAESEFNVMSKVRKDINT